MRSREDVEFVITSTLDQYGKDYSKIELIFIPKSLENDRINGDQLVEIFSNVWKNLPNNDRYSFVLSMRRTRDDVYAPYRYLLEKYPVLPPD